MLAASPSPREAVSRARTIAFLALACFLAAGLLAPDDAWARRKKKDEARDEAAKKDEKKEDDSPFKDWDKTLKDVETKKGFFTIHRKHDSIWLEIAPDQLDRPFLMVSSLSSGLGKNWLLGGMPLDTDLWVLRRAGNRIQVAIRNSRFRAPEGTPMARAVALSYGDSVLASAKIVSIHKETGNLLIDFNDVFMADLPGIGLAIKRSLGSPASFDKDRTSVESIKVFPKNVEIRIAATYSASDPKPLETVTDSRYLPIGLHYSLSELPENNFRARLADDRIGYFLTAVKDFSKDSEDTFFVRYVNRWKLEKQDPAAAISPPKEPIVFYLDRTIPAEYRDAVREGTLMWNKAFEKAGFRDAIVVRDAPDDPDFDPEDVRYNTIRWITSTEASFGAIGPSRVDPRNGHILDADILVEAVMIQNVRRGWRNYVGTRAAAPAAPWSSTAPPWSAPNPWALANSGDADGGQLSGWHGDGPAMALCAFADGAQMNAAVDAAAFTVAGEMEPGGEVPEDYVKQFLPWVMAHEVGHTLGLRHNFRASAAVPNDRLNDLAWTREHGLYNSVMEYPTANYSLDRAAQGDYFSRTVGDYDVWAIRYGYTPIEADSSEGERTALRKIAEESMRPGHEYGTDEDAFPGPVPRGVDPVTNHFDLGSDPLVYARERLALVREVRGKIHERLIAPGEGYERLRNTFDSLLGAQAQSLEIASKQIGGMRTSRSHRGQPGERPAFDPVPAARQREALEILIASGFSEEAWKADAALLDALAPSRWAHWGSEIWTGGVIDYPYTQRVLAVQSYLLDRMLHPLLLSRLVEMEARAPRGQAYTLAEHMGALSRAPFTELDARPAAGAPGLTVSPMRRNLGRALVARLVALLNDPPEGTPGDARSLARSNLTALDKRIGPVLSGRGAGMDEATKAYLEETRTAIRSALEAQSVILAGGRTGGGGRGEGQSGVEEPR